MPECSLTAEATNDVLYDILVMISLDADISPVAVIILLLASLNSCTNPWVYLAFSGSLLNQMRVGSVNTSFSPVFLFAFEMDLLTLKRYVYFVLYLGLGAPLLYWIHTRA